MPNLLLIKGPVAAGKTTVCNLIQTKLPDFKYVNLEELKGQFDGLTNFQKTEKAASVYYPKIKELMDLGVNILLQESMVNDIQNNLGEDLAKNHYNLISIFLEISLDESKKRNRDREKKLSEGYAIASYNYLAVSEDGDVLINAETKSPEEITNFILDLLKSNS